MNITTALNHERRFIEQFQSICSMAEIGGYSHDWMLQEIGSRIYNDPAFNKCPRWVRDRFQGHLTRWLKMAYFPAKLIVWRHIWNGIAYDGWDNCPEECKQAMRDNRGDSAHVWARHLPAIKRFSREETKLPQEAMEMVSDSNS